MKTFCRSLLALSLLPGAGLCQDIGAEVTGSAAPKTPAIKTITNFTQSLRCMDELFYAYGKQGIAITSAGIPDETGKVKTGTKEMLITAVSKMTVKSNAFDFIDFHSAADDLAALFAARGEESRTMPDYYIRGSITQMDDSTVRKNKGAGFSLPFLDIGASKDDSYDLISMDISIGNAATRKIRPPPAPRARRRRCGCGARRSEAGPPTPRPVCPRGRGSRRGSPGRSPDRCPGWPSCS